jgi:hypothetical protein
VTRLQDICVTGAITLMTHDTKGLTATARTPHDQEALQWLVTAPIPLLVSSSSVFPSNLISIQSLDFYLSTSCSQGMCQGTVWVADRVGTPGDRDM